MTCFLFPPDLFQSEEQTDKWKPNIHVDNPWHHSKKEIIIFEVMKVFPEVKELHKVFSPVTWS